MVLDMGLPVVQLLLKRHVPPFPHFLLQLLMLSGSLGQFPLWKVPPPLVHDEVEMHIPGWLPLLQAPPPEPPLLAEGRI